MKYKWKNDKARYLWQERLYNIFADRGWSREDLELFYNTSEQIINKQEFYVEFGDKYELCDDCILKVESIGFKNQYLFLKHEIEEYLDQVEEQQ